MSGRNFTSIGATGGYAFSGLFNGNNYRIDNLTISQISLTGNDEGLFGNVNNAIIKDLIVGKFKVASNNSPTFISNATDSLIINCADENATKTNIKATSGLKIAYGKNNIKDTSFKSQLKVSGPISYEYIVAEIDTAGGILFKDDNIQAGQMRALLSFGGSYTVVEAFSSSKASALKDYSFISNLPTRKGLATTNKIYSVKEGYKLTALADETFSIYSFDYSGDTLNIIQNGITLSYEEAVYNINVIFNRYESYLYSAEEKLITLENVKYDSTFFDSELKKILSNTAYLRSGYKIEGIYGAFDETVATGFNYNEPTYV